MSEDILERTKAIVAEYTAHNRSVGLLPDLIAEVEASRIRLREFQNHEGQTHAAMEKIVGNSDNFVELTRQMKAEVERLRSERITAIESAVDAERDRWLHDYQIQAARIKELEAELRKTMAARDEWIAIANQERLVRDRLEAQIVGRIQECQGCMAHGESAYMQSLEAAFLESEAAAHYYEECLILGQSIGPAFFGWPGRKYQAMSDKSMIDLHRKKAREALERIKADEKL